LFGYYIEWHDDVGKDASVLEALQTQTFEIHPFLAILGNVFICFANSIADGLHRFAGQREASAGKYLIGNIVIYAYSTIGLVEDVEGTAKT
jgi:hypothetical protein